MRENARPVDVHFEPEHFNRTCDRTVPEARCGWVEVDGRRAPKLTGDSRERVIEIAGDTYPGVEIDLPEDGDDLEDGGMI